MPQNTPFVNANFWSRVEVCSVPVLGQDDKYRAYWNTRPASECLHTLNPDWNNYFCVSLMDTPGVRRKANFVALHVLVVDDVGPKVDPDKARTLLGEPSYQLETSPGNQQWGYILDPPITDITRAEALINNTIKALVGDAPDPGMAGVTRLMRLPMGSNTKYTPAFRCRMVAAKMDTHDPADLERNLPVQGNTGVQISEPEPFDPFQAGAAPVPGPGPAPGPNRRAVDPTLGAMRKLGLVLGNERKASQGTGWDVRCPWVHEHTPSTAQDTGTMYFRGGGFKCWHGHCQDRKPEDVRARVNQLLSDETGGLFSIDDFDPSKFDAVDPDTVPPSPLAPEPDEVRRFWEETVYHATEDRFLTLRTDTASFNDKAFDTEWIGVLRDHLPLNAKDRPISPSQWYRNADRKQIVDGRTWWPARSRLFASAEHDKQARYLNTWRAIHRPLESATMTLPIPSVGGIGAWYRLQQLLFGARTGAPEYDANMEHWLDYQTMIVAAVGVKPGHNPLFIAPQGTGKEIILRPIIDVLGPDRYREIDQDTLKGGFTDWIMNRLVILPEVHRSTRWNQNGQDEYQRIKAFCDPGKPFLPVNQKYRGIIQAANVFVLVMSSNEDKPLAVPPDDRRIWVVRMHGTGWPVARFQALARAFSEPSPWGATNSHAIVEWLIRRYESKPEAERAAMLDRFTGHAPMTRDKTALIERSRSEVELWISELLTRVPPDPLALPDIFTAQDVMEKVENAGEIGGYGLARGTRVQGANAVGRMLRRAGCAMLNRGQSTPMPDGISRHLWAKPGLLTASAWTEQELIDWLDANRRV